MLAASILATASLLARSTPCPRGGRTLCSATTTASGLVKLQGGKSRLFKGGHPIVYGGAVQSVEGDPDPGAVVDVVDGSGGLIGWGVFNPHSMYRVRLLATEEPALLEHRDVAELLRHRLASAAQLRSACSLPSERDTAYRLVNSEGDRISGLQVDVFGGTAVAVTSALWLEQRRELVIDALSELPGVTEVVWRRSDGRLQQDGWVSEKSGRATNAGGTPPLSPSAPPDAPRPREEEREYVEIKESGLKYLVAPALGQKSGFYCDQRDNRQMLAAVSANRRVLDLFCYSGGFAISAAAAGASLCVGVDSSAPALELARRNAALNGVDATCEFVQADVHKFVRGAPGEGLAAAMAKVNGRAPTEAEEEEVSELFDVVICDPPKLAPSVKDLPRATRKYRQLNSGAMRQLKPGGLLLSCSCSAAMTQSGGFVKMLQEAAQAEGRTLTVLRTTGAASDHVINPGCPEGAYLTAVLAHVG
jgi:23S rRNA G2069 N7-methylase RlmK/C1962 C5-methylase RlmI